MKVFSHLVGQFGCHVLITANGLRLAAGGEIEFLLPGTVAKFIIKSS